mgnify:CR=1 FL=1
MMTIFALVCLAVTAEADDFRPVPLVVRSAEVQPMTGIVLWTTNAAARSAPIQLEFSYMTYDQVVRERGHYDWRAMEELLEGVARRKHQAIVRFRDTYVGKPTGVPAYIKALPDYQETTAPSETKPTGFPDWSHPELRRFVLGFYTKLAEKYDQDPRLAFLEAGFGLWAEYHIYDGPMKLGKTFPSKEYQAEFARHLSEALRETPWMLSVDAALDHAPFVGDASLMGLRFGLFDDSFNHAKHKLYNEPDWDRLGRDRWKKAPTGGEFSFFEKVDQSDALGPRGPHGVPFEEHAAKFHISFMIGDAQPRNQTADRIREAGRACGYRFRVTRFEASNDRSRLTVENRGIAPIYHHAFPTVNGVRSTVSLKGLLPRESRAFEVAAGGATPTLTIESDRLVPGQRIEYDADLQR